MESKSTKQYSVPPSDFLYYDPYYLLLKERSKSYPKVVEKFYSSKPPTKISAPDIVGRNQVFDSAGFRTDEVVSDIVKDLSEMEKSDLFLDKAGCSDSEDSSGLDRPMLQSLISTSITEALAFDPVLADRVRRIGDFLNRQEKLIKDLKSQNQVLENTLKERNEELRDNKDKLEGNVRAMSALYTEVDTLKKKREVSEIKTNLLPDNLQEEYEDLQSRYYVAMKIIDKMNWADCFDDTATVNMDQDN